MFWQFSNITIYVKIVGKIPNQHLIVWLFSNPWHKVQILVKIKRQICPVVLHLFWTFSPGFENNHTFKCWSGIFQQYLHIMLCWKIARTTFQCKLVLQSRGQHVILVEILWSHDLRVELNQFIQWYLNGGLKLIEKQNKFLNEGPKNN